MTNIQVDHINWEKVQGLIPAIIQDVQTKKVLMLGYMNSEALQKTLTEKKVFFFSRTKHKIWMKGETSGNILMVEHLYLDCDEDTLLILVTPKGATCHKGTASCFQTEDEFGIYDLEKILLSRINELPDNSYTTSLIKEGTARMAQKLGEEAVEMVIASLHEKEKLPDEAADLLYHFILLLNVHHIRLKNIEMVLRKRHKK